MAQVMEPNALEPGSLNQSSEGMCHFLRVQGATVRRGKDKPHVLPSRAKSTISTFMTLRFGTMSIVRVTLVPSADGSKSNTSSARTGGALRFGYPWSPLVEIFDPSEAVPNLCNGSFDDCAGRGSYDRLLTIKFWRQEEPSEVVPGHMPGFDSKAPSGRAAQSLSRGSPGAWSRRERARLSSE